MSASDLNVEAPPLRPPLQRSAAPRDLEPDEKDLEKIQKWQHERLQKRMRGEYESQMVHLADTINANSSTPSQIASVRIEGTQLTRPSFLKFLIDPLIPAPSPENDLQSSIQTAAKIADTLKLAGIFRSVDAKLERARAPRAGPFDVDIVVRAQEYGKFMVKAATDISGENAGSTSLDATIRNVFGGGETLTANASIGTATTRAFNTVFTMPVTPSLWTRAELQAFASATDLTSTASCTEGVRGVKALIRSGIVGRGMHEFAYNAVLRNIGHLLPAASVAIREEAGQTVKSSLTHTFVLDNRNDSLMPTKGFYLRTLNELAGLGGDAAFVKSEVNTNISRPVYPGVSLSFTARSGFILGLAGKPTLFSDRFQLGGPSSIRSFRTSGMGPRDAHLSSPSASPSTAPFSGADSLGGEVFWSAGLSVISNLPRRPEWPLKAHAWVNAGRLDNVDRSRPVGETLTTLIRRPAVSAGVGVVYTLPPARLELNFGLPLVASGSDATRRGLQLGVGLEFL
ncbi:Bac-surface-Ag domain-containing protein [Mycena kentingensis (nom. inval.)]|nr:Bac-surface-Ag domain-containing protein [Mycena kentingensis (nom. inval.)]